MVIADYFPRLGVNDSEKTSPEADRYNCIAWAAGNDTEWWEPSPDGVWPSDAPYAPTIEALTRVYASLGYEVCLDGSLETGYEKIAIYGHDGEYEHAARQLPDGRWTSKLGPNEDIVHVNAECLTGGIYGELAHFMKRKCKQK